MRVCDSLILLPAKPTKTFFLISRYTTHQIFEKNTFMLFVFFMQEDILISLTNMPDGDTTQKPSIAGLGPRSVVGRKGKSWGETEKKQNKTKQKRGKQSEPSGGLRRGKGPNSPPQTPARLASLACLLSLFLHCRTCSHFHSTTQHVAVTLIPHKWFKAI